MKRWAPALLLLVLLILLGFSLSPRGRRLGETLALLAEVWTLGGGAVSGGADSRPALIRYDGPDEAPRVADVYCDMEAGPRARLLLAHGLVEAGKDDDRLGTLGRVFARHRFLVMVPDFPGMRALRAGPQDIDEVAAAMGALSRLDGCPQTEMSGARREGEDDGLPTGVVGFSYSAGPVLLALDRRPRRADFGVLFGGYYDLAEVILFLTTGRHRDRGVDREGEAIPQGRWVLLAANADTVAEAADREALVAIARRRIDDPGASIDDLSASLGPSARAALDLVVNTDPSRFEPLLARTDPALRRVLDALSPSKSLSRPLPVDLYLLHARGDRIVPYSQSLRMRSELSTEGAIQLVLLGGFRHARPERSTAEPWWVSAVRHPSDSFGLIGVLDEILARRLETP